jgi:hypothetical protein
VHDGATSGSLADRCSFRRTRLKAMQALEVIMPTDLPPHARMQSPAAMAAARKNSLDEWARRGTFVLSVGSMTSAMVFVGWIVMRSFA